MNKHGLLHRCALATLSAVMAWTPTPALGEDSGAPTKQVMRDRAFEAAQWAMIGDAAAALTRIAAATARGSGPIASLEKKREELTQQRDASERRYLELAKSDPAAGARELQSLSAMESELAVLGDQIDDTDPAYADLTRPRALPVQQVQALLNPEEALIMILANEDASYTFAVTRESAAWSRAEGLPAAGLREKIKALRSQLGVDQARGLERSDGAASTFDRNASYELYRQLVMPVEATLKGKTTLLTVSDGPLAELPLQLLVTGPPQGSSADPAALASTPWLIDKFAVAALPAVSSLAALRCLLVPQEQRHRGCRGTRSRSRSPGLPAQVVFTGFGAPVLGGAPADARSVPPGFESAFRGEFADPARLRSLPSLPGSKGELEALSAQFGPTRSQVHLGADATESAIKSDLAMQSARYVVYSTHGLLAAETGQVGEPGLVFTPPANNDATSEDDGLLTASEAARLKLAADLVVLSACNTAAPAGGDTTEGLSGLARAFLFAGARALLVSNWPVDDAATSRLMIGTFKELDAGSTNRAQAFRVAVQTLRADPRFASPAYWAPFTLVGTP